MENQQKSWNELVGRGALAFVEGHTSFDGVLNGLGMQVVGDVQKTIARSDFKKLSPITIALRRLRHDGVQIGGRLIGEVAAAIAAGQTGPGQLGDQTFSNQYPLRESGHMIATMTYEVH